MVKSGNVTVTTTATTILAAHPSTRRIALHAKGTLYLGGSDVTTTIGYKMDNGDKVELEIYANDVLYGITSASTSDITVLYNI
jgi:hypothetical protein